MENLFINTYTAGYTTVIVLMFIVSKEIYVALQDQIDYLTVLSCMAMGTVFTFLIWPIGLFNRDKWLALLFCLLAIWGGAFVPVFEVLELLPNPALYQYGVLLLFVCGGWCWLSD